MEGTVNPEAFDGSDGPELQRYLTAEADSIEQLLRLADAVEATNPARSMYLRINARKRALQLLAIREWLDLR
ncbi:hypothetical protein [Jatrophihabitans endophyticus]|uniref:hypothetical protein n=1 Tax=Jatrophihabitans endophyticus TaxID=1206085 RepID=UPI0009352F89|nr:hypothetical protein [Jatrophihabitans endophyticus]